MPEATEMLREDHQKVKDLFDEFENAEEADEKLRIVHRPDGTGDPCGS